MKISFIYILFLFPVIVWSQDVLTLNKAIEIALAQNYGIQISELEQKADLMQVYKSNAGFGPTVDWNANIGVTGNRVNQQFLDGRILNRFGRSLSPGTNISAGITILDGGRRQAILDRLSLLGQYSAIEGKIILQNTIVDVMQAYYDITRNEETLSYLETIIKYYEERLKITEQRWQVGKGSKLDFLQSQIDLNAQLSGLVNSKNNIRNGKVVLNGILNRDLATEFEIEKIENINSEYDLNSLMEKVKVSNQDLVLMQKAIDINLKREKELEATLKPQVDLSGSFSYSYNNSNTGFLSSSQSLAIPLGVSARYNIYDGKNRKNQIAISKVNTDIVRKQQLSLAAQIEIDLTLAYNQYISDKELLSFEEKNTIIAEENLSISLDKFRLGGSTILELNEAQRAYDTSLNRLVTAQYNVKISELDLLRLTGSLLD